MCYCTSSCSECPAPLVCCCLSLHAPGVPDRHPTTPLNCLQAPSQPAGCWRPRAPILASLHCSSSSTQQQASLGPPASPPTSWPDSRLSQDGAGGRHSWVGVRGQEQPAAARACATCRAAWQQQGFMLGWLMTVRSSSVCRLCYDSGPQAAPV
jgi:hypothetical protein